MATPTLSIGIIFRNDIRCIERCLKALQPLRDVIPCELVMADTGSDDGSRAIAEEYADILFEFPWINDFAAARNAVMDRCTGEWFLSVDTDEYLDEDISELLNFLRTADNSMNMCQVNIRNYKSYEMDGVYADFYTLRMVRLSIGARYQGTIHESWNGIQHKGPSVRLANTIFHHDGYVNMGQNHEKLKRNMTLLRKKLRKEPQNLLIRLQMIESGIQEEDYLDILHKAVALVRRKPVGWNVFGPPIVRYAVVVAKDRKLPEFPKWADMAREWFPDSYYTRIDVAAQCMTEAYEKDDYPACTQLGEGLMAAYADFRAGHGDMDCQMYSTLHLSSPYHEQLFRLMMANACLETDCPERAAAHLEELDYSQLDGGQAGNLAKILCSLHSKSTGDTKRLILSAWEGITAPNPSKKRAEERRLNFMLNGSIAFTPGYRQEEARKGQRPAYVVFAPLADKCGLGIAAAVMESGNPEEIVALLETVEKWNELPFPALSHAIQHNVIFPLPGRPLCIEEMDGLARRLAGDRNALFSLVEQLQSQDFSAAWQTLTWTQMLVLAAVQNCYWDNEEQGMALAHTFVRVESEYISRYYTTEILNEENLLVLPEVHRFGWYCAQAFASLDAGDAAGYAHLLRKGLDTCKAMKPMVNFLLEHTPELHMPEPDPELMDLAGKVHDLLNLYPQNDPAVIAIKQSPVYQRVAHLIEEDTL